MNLARDKQGKCILEQHHDWSCSCSQLPVLAPLPPCFLTINSTCRCNTYPSSSRMTQSCYLVNAPLPPRAGDSWSRRKIVLKGLASAAPHRPAPSKTWQIHMHAQNKFPVVGSTRLQAKRHGHRVVVLTAFLANISYVLRSPHVHHLCPAQEVQSFLGG